MKCDLLFADGDRLITEDYRSYFSRFGYAVEIVSSAIDCLQKLRDTLPAVLILDAELPLNGAEGVLSVVQESKLHSSVPLVFIVSDNLPELLARRLNLPESRRLSKPFHLAVLLERIRGALAEL